MNNEHFSPSANEVEEAFLRIGRSQRADFLPGGTDQAAELIEGIRKIVGAEFSCSSALNLYLDVAKVISLFGNIDGRNRKTLISKYSLSEDAVGQVIDLCEGVFHDYGERGDGSRHGPVQAGSDAFGASAKPTEHKVSPEVPHAEGHPEAAGPSIPADAARHITEENPLVGRTIRHRAYGDGYVESIEGDRLTVRFPEGSRVLSLSSSQKYMDFYVTDGWSDRSRKRSDYSAVRVSNSVPEYRIDPSGHSISGQERSETKAGRSLPDEEPPASKVQKSGGSRAVVALCAILAVALAAVGSYLFLNMRRNANRLESATAAVTPVITPEPVLAATPTPFPTAPPSDAAPAYEFTSSELETDYTLPPEDEIIAVCASCGKELTEEDCFRIDLSLGTLALCEDCYRDLAQAELSLDDEETPVSLEDEEFLATLPPQWLALEEFDQETVLMLMQDFPVADTGIEKAAYFPQLQALAVILTRDPAELATYTYVPLNVYQNLINVDNPYTYYWTRIASIYSKTSYRLNMAEPVDEAADQVPVS